MIDPQRVRELLEQDGDGSDLDAATALEVLSVLAVQSPDQAARARAAPVHKEGLP